VLILSPFILKVKIGWLRCTPAVRYAAVPDRLASARVLVLLLAPGLYGEYLASSLKLWKEATTSLLIKIGSRQIFILKGLFRAKALHKNVKLLPGFFS
jgi:hypothetical protein